MSKLKPIKKKEANLETYQDQDLFLAKLTANSHNDYSIWDSYSLKDNDYSNTKTPPFSAVVKSSIFDLVAVIDGESGFGDDKVTLTVYRHRRASDEYVRKTIIRNDTAIIETLDSIVDLMVLPEVMREEHLPLFMNGSAKFKEQILTTLQVIALSKKM